MKRTIEEMKELVREDFRNDDNNQLIGFLHIENTVEGTPYPQDYMTEGAVLVVYRACTEEVTAELLTDMVGFIEDRQQE